MLLLLGLERPEGRSERLATIAQLWVLTPLVLELNRRGWTRTASWSLVLALIAVVTYRAWQLGGMNGAVSPFYVILVMMAGVLLGIRAGVITALLCIACGIGLVVAADRGAVPPSTIGIPPHAALVYLGMFMGLTLLLQRLIVSSLRHGLRRRERLVHDLRERVKELRLLS